MLDAMIRSLSAALRLCVLAAAAALAVDPWPGEAWTAATDLTFLNPSGWASNLSGAYWNPVTRRLWVANNSGHFSRIREDRAGGFALEATFSPGGDFEAITQADPSADVVYLVVEGSDRIRRYNANTGVLERYWDLTSLVGGMADDNDGLEGIAFIPDAWLAASGFRDGNGNPYPKSVHGAEGLGGIMLVAVQDRERATAGFVYAVDLRNDGTWAAVGSYKTSRGESCELAFDASTGRLYILHNVDGNVLEITDLTSEPWGAYRKFTTLREIRVPSASNIEGFALAPALKPDGSLGDRRVFFTDDDNAQGALRVFSQLPSALVALAGDGQSAPARASAPVRPAARAQDAFGNGIPGYPVSFQVTAGGGTVSGGLAVTDSVGVARPAAWTLGPAPGPNALAASAEGLAGSPLTFVATGTDGTAVSRSSAPNAEPRLEFFGNRLVLVTQDAGTYRLRWRDARGRMVREVVRRLEPGRHEFVVPQAAVFVDVKSEMKNEK